MSEVTNAMRDIVGMAILLLILIVVLGIYFLGQFQVGNLISQQAGNTSGAYTNFTSSAKVGTTFTGLLPLLVTILVFALGIGILVRAYQIKSLSGGGGFLK